jgi:hypothetical protein
MHNIGGGATNGSIRLCAVYLFARIRVRRTVRACCSALVPRQGRSVRVALAQKNGAQILGAKVSPFDNQREVARPVRSAWHSVSAMQPSLGLGSLAATI